MLKSLFLCLCGSKPQGPSSRSRFSFNFESGLLFLACLLLSDRLDSSSFCSLGLFFLPASLRLSLESQSFGLSSLSLKPGLLFLSCNLCLPNSLGLQSRNFSQSPRLSLLGQPLLFGQSLGLLQFSCDSYGFCSLPLGFFLSGDASLHSSHTFGFGLYRQSLCLELGRFLGR